MQTQPAGRTVTSRGLTSDPSGSLLCVARSSWASLVELPPGPSIVLAVGGGRGHQQTGGDRHSGAGTPLEGGLAQPSRAGAVEEPPLVLHFGVPAT